MLATRSMGLKLGSPPRRWERGKMPPGAGAVPGSNRRPGLNLPGAMAIVISQPTRIASERQIHVQTQPAHAAAPSANAVNTPLSSPNDAQLLQRVAAHDRQAFAQLYDRYATILFSTICRVLNNRDE